MDKHFEILFLDEAFEFLSSLERKHYEKILYNIRKSQVELDPELFKKLSDEITLDEWRQTLALNLDATFVLTRAAIAQMRKARQGDASVVVISSQIGLVGHARGAAYAASKAGLNGMVKSLALEWAQEGVRINAVGPGPVATPMVAPTMADPVALAAMQASIPMARLGQPDEIGEVVSFLLSQRASFITGQILCADGGFTAR